MENALAFGKKKDGRLESCQGHICYWHGAALRRSVGPVLAYIEGQRTSDGQRAWSLAGRQGRTARWQRMRGTRCARSARSPRADRGAAAEERRRGLHRGRGAGAHHACGACGAAVVCHEYTHASSADAAHACRAISGRAVCPPRALAGGHAAAGHGVWLVRWARSKADMARPPPLRTHPKLQRRPREREGDAAARMRFAVAVD